MYCNEPAGCDVAKEDFALIDALVKASFHTYKPNGDGKFSRAKNVVDAQVDNIAMIKKALSCRDDKALAFVLGFEAAFLQMQAQFSAIASGNYKKGE
jgi:hypothetical protein